MLHHSPLAVNLNFSTVHASRSRGLIVSLSAESIIWGYLELPEVSFHNIDNVSVVDESSPSMLASATRYVDVDTCYIQLISLFVSSHSLFLPTLSSYQKHPLLFNNSLKKSHGSRSNG